MLIFSTFFRLLKRLKGAIFVYSAIFLTLAIIMTKVQTTDNAKSFSENRLAIAVVNRSQGEFGDALKTYFGEKNDIVDVPDDEQEITNMLYWRELDYALIIPEGFEESLKEDGTFSNELECIEVPGNFDSSFFKAELEMYLTKLTGLMAGGMELQEAVKELDQLKGEETSVEMASFVNEKQGDMISSFFSYAPYLFLSLGIMVVSSVLIFFNETEVKKRMECSNMPLVKRQISLFGGIVAFGIILLIVVLGIAMGMSKGALATDVRLPYFLLNLITMLLFALSLAFFAGNLFAKTESVNGFVNVVSLALCFLGGIFVPQEFFSEGVQKAAKFMPTYWYTKSNQMISSMATVTDSFQRDIFLQNLFVFSTTVAVLAITITIVAIRRKKVA